MKEKCLELGIEINLIQMDEESLAHTAINKIIRSINNRDIHGIMVQLLLPRLPPPQREIIDTVPPSKKDVVDGLLIL